jgi:hypothetical protein
MRDLTFRAPLTTSLRRRGHYDAATNVARRLSSRSVEVNVWQAGEKERRLGTVTAADPADLDNAADGRCVSEGFDPPGSAAVERGRRSMKPASSAALKIAALRPVQRSRPPPFQGRSRQVSVREDIEIH